MAVEDTWTLRDGVTRSKRWGRGLRYRVRKPGHPTKSFRTRREAERHWASILHQPTRPVADTTTVGELVEAWLAGKAGLSPRGQRACTDAADHVLRRWDAVPAIEVRRSEVQAWLAGITVERGPRGDRRRAPASASLLAKIKQAMSGAMEVAVEQGIIEANPCAKVSVPAESARDARYLTVAELRRIIDALDEEWRPLAWLLGTMGLRIGEATQLLVGDVDQARRRVRVRGRTTKTRRGRDVPIPAAVFAMLDLDRPGDVPLFTTPRGFGVDVRNFRRVWTGAAASVQIACTVHDLRHTAASLAIASGADVKSVQAMLGHATATMTLDRYGHLWDDRLDDVAARMDGLIADQ